MKTVQRLAFCLVSGLMIPAPVVSAAEPQYPSRPIRLIVAAATGGPNDLIARMAALPWGDLLGKPIVVDNRPGASSAIGAEIVTRAPADGYTLMLGTNSTLAVIPSIRLKPPFDPIRDYDPISLMSSSPYLLVVHPTVPATTVKELIAMAKAKPGELNYASPGYGTSNHLSFELLKVMAGIDITHVPYKGTSAMTTDLLGGRVSVMLVSTASVRPVKYS